MKQKYYLKTQCNSRLTQIKQWHLSCLIVNLVFVSCSESAESETLVGRMCHWIIVSGLGGYHDPEPQRISAGAFVQWQKKQVSVSPSNAFLLTFNHDPIPRIGAFDKGRKEPFDCDIWFHINCPSGPVHCLFVSQCPICWFLVPAAVLPSNNRAAWIPWLTVGTRGAWLSSEH